uniref:Putative secreted protein n=1 Tax=Rhipicephalus microplus TaxID=6941 RepID=A0A6G5A3Z7_RHIMP
MDVAHCPFVIFQCVVFSALTWMKGKGNAWRMRQTRVTPLLLDRFKNFRDHHEAINSLLTSFDYHLEKCCWAPLKSHHCHLI